MSLADIQVTQKKVMQILHYWLKYQKVPHTLLFYGAAGSGKSFFSHHFAQDFLCQSPQEGFACQSCLSCKTWKAGTHPDYHCFSVDPGQTLGIDIARKIQEIACWKPVYSNKNCIVIDDIDQMTSEAFNSMLKTLEEPNPSSQFVMTSSKIDHLPSTILSRAIRIPFHRLNSDQLIPVLDLTTHDPDWKDIVLLLSHGNLNKAIFMLADEQKTIITQWIEQLLLLFSESVSSFPVFPKNQPELYLDIWKTILREWYKMKLTSSQNSILWREEMMAKFLKIKCSARQLLNIQEKLIMLEADLNKTRINAKSNADFWMISSRQCLQ